MEKRLMKNWKSAVVGTSILLTAVGGAWTAYAATTSLAATPATTSAASPAAATWVQSGIDVGSNVNIQQQLGRQVGGVDPVESVAKHAEGAAVTTPTEKPETGEAASTTGADVGPNVQVQQNFQNQH
ncbi:hypothetical protein D2Q93_13990 [Alicyclobacillaceae bacterium I2511]|nr:hypothetical protein D2Q93_13990 [Alicyclobacillaceae bacterium I2511]